MALDLDVEMVRWYLLGCEDECIPEPKTLEQFERTWKAGDALTPASEASTRREETT